MGVLPGRGTWGSANSKWKTFWGPWRLTSTKTSSLATLRLVYRWERDTRTRSRKDVSARTAAGARHAVEGEGGGKIERAATPHARGNPRSRRRQKQRRKHGKAAQQQTYGNNNGARVGKLGPQRVQVHAAVGGALVGQHALQPLRGHPSRLCKTKGGGAAARGEQAQRRERGGGCVSAEEARRAKNGGIAATTARPAGVLPGRAASARVGTHHRRPPASPWRKRGESTRGTCEENGKGKVAPKLGRQTPL